MNGATKDSFANGLDFFLKNSFNLYMAFPKNICRVALRERGGGWVSDKRALMGKYLTFSWVECRVGSIPSILQCD